VRFYFRRKVGFQLQSNLWKMKTKFFTSLRKSWEKFLERRETTTNFVEIGKNIFFLQKKSWHFFDDEKIFLCCKDNSPSPSINFEAFRLLVLIYCFCLFWSLDFF
jgi:hypothetical protein